MRSRGIFPVFAVAVMTVALGQNARATEAAEPISEAAEPISEAAEPISETATKRLGALVEAYYEELLELHPILATYNGDHRFDDRLSVSIAPDHRRRALELELHYQGLVAAIDPEACGLEDRLTRELFLYGRELTIATHEIPYHLMPVDQFQSMPVLFAMLGAGGSIQPFEVVEDYQQWLGRLAGWGAWVDQAIANMRHGIEAGVVQPRIIVERVLPMLEAHASGDPRDSSFFQPITNMPPAIEKADRGRLEGQYLVAIRDLVAPGYKRLYDFLHDEYQARSRESVGLSALPGGGKWYALLVRQHTTTALTPEEIHHLGLAEVERIEREIVFVSSRSWPAAPARRADVGRLLDGYRSLQARVESRLLDLFGHVPDADFEIRPVEEFRRSSAAGASYVAGTADGSRPGVFYVNAAENSRGTPSDALFLHEALPGHHFQISLQRELGHLPRFRRFGQHTAFIEGWGLYAESLGEQLGLYQSREQCLWALRSELFRARRLVVDTGLHAMGWSRRRAIGYLGSANEVDRYIAFPGQALAYKIGQLRILELRKKAELLLGERFDVRAFHDQLLGGGAMPLDVLESRIDLWLGVGATQPGLTE